VVVRLALLQADILRCDIGPCLVEHCYPACNVRELV
jgi:hypothetical protein